MIKDVPLSHAFLYLRQLQSHARTNLRTQQQFRCHPSIVAHIVFKLYSLSFLTSVRRTALCWDAMLPRPEYTCGSSVMLCSPSCSASLSERFAPLRVAAEHRILHQITDIGTTAMPFDPRTKTLACLQEKPLLHHQLTDVLKLAHVGELLLHQLLDPTAHPHRDDLQAAAGWEHDHVGQCDIYSVNTRNLVISWRLISAFTLNIHH